MRKRTIAIISSVVGVVGGILGQKYFAEGSNSVAETEKFRSYYNMLNQWLCLKNEGKKIETYFKENGYNSIAIYGLGEMGTRLYEELKETSIKIKYVIDQSALSENLEIKVKGVHDELDDVDVIVVTPIFAFEEIEKALSEKVEFPIISLEEIIYELYVI